MVKRLGFSTIIFTILLTVIFIPSAIAQSQPIISADAAILMDLKTGQVLYAKNPFKQRPPASTTKILTALMAIEAGKQNQMVKVSRKSAYTEGSSMYLKVGEIISMSDLIYGALMHSGNDACEAIAETIAGSSEQFAVLMNVKALSLGAINSHFVNPHGLPDDRHYTSAYDLGLIARHALNNPVFSNIVSTRNKMLTNSEGEAERRLSNTNKLLWKYLWADGVKTGTTNKAGQCLISSATKGNRRLVAVVLHSGDRWQDSMELFEFGFNRFEYSQVAVAGAEFGRLHIQNGEQAEVSVDYGSDLGLLLPLEKPDAIEKRVVYDAYPVAPIRKGQVMGSVNFFIKGSYSGKVNLVAASNVHEKGVWNRIWDWFRAR